jgi:hypothetical protein
MDEVIPDGDLVGRTESNALLAACRRAAIVSGKRRRYVRVQAK